MFCPARGSERRLSGGAYGQDPSFEGCRRRTGMDQRNSLSDEALPKEVVRATLPPLPANASPRLTVAYRALQKAYRAKDGYPERSTDRQLADAATRYSGQRVTQDTIRRLLGTKK
jgi:hypothetical protein